MGKLKGCFNDTGILGSRAGKRNFILSRHGWEPQDETIVFSGYKFIPQSPFTES